MYFEIPNVNFCLAPVFAYGATGAGKTFTMLGGPDCPGVIFLTMVDLYRRIGEIAQDKLCDVAVSYLEVLLQKPSLLCLSHFSCFVF